MANVAPLVIVGTGLAGYNLAKEFRKLDAEREMVLISADDGRFYSKPLLSTGFAKGKQADELAMQDAASMAEQLRARIITGTRATALDPATRTLWLADQPLAYGDLVLASGAVARQLPWAEELGERLLSVNDLVDYGRFRRALEGRRSVIIVGAGLIGCEFANDLVSSGYQVQVVAPDRQLMPGLLPEPVAAAVQSALEALGVRFHLGQAVDLIEPQSSGLRLVLEDGTTLEAEQGLSAIGLQANTALAEAAGLAVGRGVQVDRRLRTSDPHIHALGDCAEVEGLALMYVMPLMTSARALAQNLAGNPTDLSYPAMPIMVKTPACPLVVSPPLLAAEGEWLISGEGLDQRALFHDTAGQLQGYALSGSAVSEKAQLHRQLPGWLA